MIIANNNVDYIALNDNKIQAVLYTWRMEIGKSASTYLTLKADF